MSLPQAANRKTWRVAYLATHPIQYQAPFLRFANTDPDIYLKAFFASDFSARAFVDPEFGRAIEWDTPLLEGYDWEVLPVLPGLRYPGDSYFDVMRPFSVGMRQRLRAGGFDALWVHGYARLPHVWAMLAARSAGKAVLVRNDTGVPLHPPQGLRRSSRRMLFGMLDRLVDGWITVGSHNEAHYRRFGIDARKFFRLGYAVDNAWFRMRIAEATQSSETLRRTLGIPVGRPIVLYAAKLIARKAPLDLIEAFARVLKESAAAAQPFLVMAGDGDMRAQIEAAIVALGMSQDVCIAGFQPQAALAGLYALCDVFVLPSAHEPWGLVVNEVMNAGKAVIASDRVGAAADLVQPGVNGYVYPYGDVDALADRLRTAMADPQRLGAMGAESLRIIEGWDFVQNIAGLKAALAATVRR